MSSTGGAMVFIRGGGDFEAASIYSNGMSKALIEGYESVAGAPARQGETQQKPVRELASRPPTVQAGKVDSASVERMFHDTQDISHLVIIDNERLPVGLLTRSRLYIKTGGAYGYALFANKLVDSLASPEFVVANAASPVSTVAAVAMSRDLDTLYDPIVVVEDDGRFVGTVTIKDLLESAENALLKAKRRAEDEARRKSEFLSAMSHEIRTPLNAIVNMSRAIERSRLDEFQGECCGTLLESANHLLGVVDNILDFSRLEAGRLSIEKVDFDLRKLLEFCRKTAALQLRGKAVEILLEEEASVPSWAKGDPLRLRQILLNLLGNAIKFTHFGRIVLKVQSVGKLDDGSFKLLFSVSDTGVGIPKRLLPGLFKRFTQADVSTCRMYGGSGLGLSICKQLVDLMGGSIWVESQEGRGSVFSFTAIFAEGSREKAVEIEPSHERSHACFDGSFEKIDALLVEDNPFNVKVARLLFNEMGHSMTSVDSGKAALEELSKRSFDLVLTDIEMPEMDGFELTRLIREREAAGGSERIPIVAISAHVGSAWRDKCLDSGMDAYLAKPVDPAELASILRRFKRRSIAKAQAGTDAPESSDTSDFFDLESTRLRSGGNERIVKEMRRIFAEETPSMLRAARKAFSVRDFHALRICSHSLKGNAASVDSKSCAEVAKALEESAQECDETRISELLPRLEHEFSSAVAALIRHYPELERKKAPQQ